jgi:DNA-binding NtrC family response regulator
MLEIQSLTPAASQARPLRDLVAEYERRLIVEALEGTGGNQRRAAASLGLLPTTLHEKMKRLGLLTRRGAERLE